MNDHWDTCTWHGRPLRWQRVAAGYHAYGLDVAVDGLLNLSVRFVGIAAGVCMQCPIIKAFAFFLAFLLPADMAHDCVGQLSKCSCERCSQRLYTNFPRWWMRLTWLQLCDAWACYCLDQKQCTARHAGRAWGYKKFTLREARGIRYVACCRCGRLCWLVLPGPDLLRTAGWRQ